MDHTAIGENGFSENQKSSVMEGSTEGQPRLDPETGTPALEVEEIKSYYLSHLARWKEGDIGLNLGSLLNMFAPFGGHRRYGELTWHERVFAAWYPKAEKQVTFGTGRGGLAKWGATSYTADFFFRDGKEIWEIDGPYHNSPESRNRDARKEAFLESLGYKVYRAANKIIENLVERALMEYAEWRAGIRTDVSSTTVFRVQPLLTMIRKFEADKEILQLHRQSWGKDGPERKTFEELTEIERQEKTIKDKWMV